MMIKDWQRAFNKVSMNRENTWGVTNPRHYFLMRRDHGHIKFETTGGNIICSILRRRF